MVSSVDSAGLDAASNPAKSTLFTTHSTNFKTHQEVIKLTVIPQQTV